jgi:hypothetical protein
MYNIYKIKKLFPLPISININTMSRHVSKCKAHLYVKGESNNIRINIASSRWEVTAEDICSLMYIFSILLVKIRYSVVPYLTDKRVEVGSWGKIFPSNGKLNF